MFPDNELVPLLTSSIGLLLVLMYFPGGLAQIGYLAGTAIDEWAVRRFPPPCRRWRSGHGSRRSCTRRVEPRDDAAELVHEALRAENISVRFGGNVRGTGCERARHRGEIVGLIGTNGAGKSTLLNAIGGYVRTWLVELLGRGASPPLGVDAAPSVGWVARLAALLFPELTVRRDDPGRAQRAQGRTPFVATASALPSARRSERTPSGRRRADLVPRVATPIPMWSTCRRTGTFGSCGIANLLALDARVLCLDEPTAGLARRNREVRPAARLDPRRDVGLHDDHRTRHAAHRGHERSRLLPRTGCSDLRRRPSAVRNDPLVIASYLRTDERAIEQKQLHAQPSEPSDAVRAHQ